MERVTNYETRILELENDKAELKALVVKKGEDISFLNRKIQQLKDVNAREVDERKKLDNIVEQQYREHINLEQSKRKADEDR